MTAWAALLIAALLQTGASSIQAMTTIAKGPHSAIETPRQAVVRSEAEWKTLWQAHTGGQPAPAVDFTRDMVVGVFMGTRPTGGFSVEIVGTRQDQGSLVVEYRETRPGRGAITAQVLTAPFHLVTIPRFAGDVTFQEVKTVK
jgi:hypothetical protein